ncbi:MAG: Secreted protein [Solirubrobacterales bacterium]|nr:Secreted protein [Solirubrobacterales bacterium]
MLHRPPVHVLLALSVLAALAVGGTLALAQSAAPPPVVSFTLGKPKSPPTGPATVPAGAVRFSVSTTAKGMHTFQVVRVAPGADVAAVAARLGKVTSEDAFEALKEVSAVGGTTVTPAADGSAVYPMLPGTYLFADITSDRGTPSIPFTVAGDPATAPGLPDAKSTLSLLDYRFELAGSPPRKGDMQLVNKGRRNHILVAFKTRNAASSARAVKALKAGNDRAAGKEIRSQATGASVIGPGERQDLAVVYTPGSYVFVCFWRSKQSKERPHSRLGMAKAVTVK